LEYTRQDSINAKLARAGKLAKVEQLKIDSIKATMVRVEKLAKVEQLKIDSINSELEIIQQKSEKRKLLNKSTVCALVFTPSEAEKKCVEKLLKERDASERFLNDLTREKIEQKCEMERMEKTVENKEKEFVDKYSD